MKTPAPFKSLFKSQRPLHPWPNPKESIGSTKSFITLRKGYLCWEAIGPASKLFEEELAPAATRYLDSCLVSDTYAVQLSLYMIGRTEDSAAPHLFIVCKDKATRRNARELLDESLIMQDKRFAGFRLGVSAVAPGEPALQHFTPVRYTDERVPSNNTKNSDTAVYLPSSSQSLYPGTSIFVSHVVDDSKVQRIKATVGLVLYSGTERYLLTAGHPFEPPSTEAFSTSTDDPRVSDPEDLECDFDGLSDTEEESFNEEEEEMLSIASRSSGDGLDDGDAYSHSSSSGEGTSASTLQSPAEPTASVPNPSNFSSLQTPNDTKPHYPVPLLGPNDIIGKVILSGSKDGLDYGLVEITNDKIFATNQLFTRTTSTEAPRSLEISSIGGSALKSPVDVLTATSFGLLDGKLDPAPTYIRLPGSTCLEKVHIGHFNGTLEKGDCGAAVVDSTSGNFYGHIIGGNPGTGIAYVISGEAIFADLEMRHRKKVTFSPLPASSIDEPATSASDMKCMHTILMRKLPSSTSQDTLPSILLFAKDLIDCELVSASKYPEDKGFVSAIARFRSLEGAKEARDLLNGKRSASNDATLIVEMVQDNIPRAIGSRRNTVDSASVRQGSVSTTTRISGVTTNGRRSSRYNGTFQSMEEISLPNETLGLGNGEFPVQNLFSPTSPVSTAFLHRKLGNSVVNDEADDQSTLPQRTTNPAIPVSRFASLSLNPSSVNDSLPMPNYAWPRAAATMQSPGIAPSAMSPHTIPSALDNLRPSASYQQYQQHSTRTSYPPVDAADQNPPCNTLYVGNLPIDTSEDELKAVFSKQRGYKRLCFRTKQNGPMCFVEFEDVSFATKALNDLYGYPLHNSVKGGIRLSFSKNPLGVRTGQSTGMGPIYTITPTPLLGSRGNVTAPPGFSTATGPPPGLSAPPGLSTPSHANSTSGFGMYSNDGFGTSPNDMASPVRLLPWRQD